MEDEHRYDDLLDLPWPRPGAKPRMRPLERAAQFSPFAALTGYGEAIEEAARETERRVELGDAEKAELDRKLQIARDRLNERPVLVITYFVPDPRKEGGRYDTVRGALRRIRMEDYALTLENDLSIDIDDIVAIEGEIFEGV